MLEAALEGNSILGGGMLTGTFDAIKRHSFSDLDRIYVYTITDKRYS